jgi:hypothetical protein
MEIEQRQDVASKQTNTTAETGIPTASGSSAPEVSQSSTISEAITISSQIPDGENKYSSPTRIAAESRLATVLAKCDVSSSSAVITTPQRIHGSSDAINTPGISQTSNTGASTTNSAAAISSKGRVSGGAAAGVAIAMLLVGALIAGAVLFFLLRHQKKRQPPTSTAYQTLHPPYDAATALPEKGPTATGAFATSIDDMLPQPAADDTITDAALKIRDNVKNHVRTHYHSAPVSVAGINQVGLQELATATGVSSSILAGAFSNPSTRQDALRLFIGWIMLARCTEERDPSLLPAELSRLAISIPERDPGMITQASICLPMRLTLRPQPDWLCIADGRPLPGPCCSSGSGTTCKAPVAIRLLRKRPHILKQSWHHFYRVA